MYDKHLNCKKIYKISIFLLFILLFFSINIFADFIVLKDGNEYTGKLIKITDTEIYFKTNNEEKVFKKTDVLKLLISQKRKFYNIDNINNLPDKNLLNYIKTPISEELSQQFNFVTILAKTEIKYENNKKVKELTKIVKVLNNGGIEQSANYYIWDPDNSDVSIDYAFTIAPNGMITHIDDSTINIAKYQVIKGYNSRKIIKFTLPDVVVGSTIVYKIKQTFKDNKNTNFYYEFFEQSSNPILNKELILWVKKGENIDILKYNNPSIEINKTTSGNYNVYSFKSSFIKKLEIEPSTPTKYDIYSYIIIKSKKDNSIKNYLNKLIDSKTAKMDSDLLYNDFKKSDFYKELKKNLDFAKDFEKNKADLLKQNNNNKNSKNKFSVKINVNKEDFVLTSKVYSIFKYVSKTFDNVSISVESEKMHSAQEIIKNGYATYIEKILLAYNLLNKLNLNPEIVMVHTNDLGENFDPNNLNENNFDRILFKINNKYFIPFNFYIFPGLLSEEFNNAYAYENGQIIKLPELSIDFYKTTRKVIYEILDTNTTKVTMNIEYSPIVSYSLRFYFSQNKNNFQNYISDIVKSMFYDVESIDVEANDPLNVYDNIKLKITFKTSMFLRQSSNLGLFNFEFNYVDASELSKDTRIYPLTYNGMKSYQIIHREIHFPKKWSINFIPDFGKFNSNIENNNISYNIRFLPLASFFSSLFGKDNVIFIDEIYKRNLLIIEPKTYVKFKSLIDNRNDSYVQYFVLNIKK